MELPESKLVKDQKKKVVRVIGKEKLVITLRFDDDCGNGHNTFSITADFYYNVREMWKWQAGGCLHDAVVRFAPELEKYIKWHLVSTDGPMHYLSNTTYLAGDRDCWGGKKGDVKWSKYNVLVTGYKNGNSFAELVFDYPPSENYKLLDKKEAEEMAERLDGVAVPVPWKYHEGKIRELDAARRIAVWPDVPDEILCADKKDLERWLLARLPALMLDFKAAMEELGFEY